MMQPRAFSPGSDTVNQSSQLNWLAQSEEEAVHDDLHQLLSETRGVVEKLADPADAKFGEER